jgi:hypothetical protein
MRYRRLDINGDYVFGQGRKDYLEGTEAVSQAIKTRLNLFLEEWWENPSDGLPLWQQILGKFGPNGNKDAIDLLIKNRIASTTDVTQITAFVSEYNVSTRSYTCQCTVDTKYGTISVTY